MSTSAKVSQVSKASVADEAVGLLAGSELKKDVDLLKKELMGVVKKEALAAVLAVTEGIPFFGKCVAHLAKLSKVCDAADANKKATAVASQWAKLVSFTLINAAPALEMADDSDGTVADLLKRANEAITGLVDMTNAYGNRSYIVKCLTSSSFKTAFDAAKEMMTGLLTNLSMVMQAVQLKLAADPTKSAIVKEAVMTNMMKTGETMQCNVAVDEKLDVIIQQQHEILQQEKKLLEGQGQADVKLDNLLHLIGNIDPNAADRKLEFTISGTMSQHMSVMDPMNQGISTHGGIITPWVAVSEELLPGEVLTEDEWTWIGKFVGAKLEYDHGKVPFMEVMQIAPRLQAVLTPRVKGGVDEASTILKLDQRGIKLKLVGCTFEAVGGNTHLELSWSAIGVTIKSTAVEGITLPIVAPSSVKKAVYPMDGMGAGPGAGCCCVVS